MVLEKIKKPADLKKLKTQELKKLASEIRSRIVQVVSKQGGHLASNLGVVELTIALLYCLKLPEDKIIWDVGHQSYAFKLLTGRNKKFDRLRQYGGLSGFPNPLEALDYDMFYTGHSGTAISTALGLAVSRQFLKEDYDIAAVIGDGSLSSGMCFEALNHAGDLNADMLVIFNNNEMSIAPAVGAVSNYLNKVISGPVYNRFKSQARKYIQLMGIANERWIDHIHRLEESVKNVFIPGILFEELGFRYFGPLDGHDLRTLISTIQRVKGFEGPKLVHVITKKGKGYKFAEQHPEKFHSAPKFNISTGESVAEKKNTFTEVFSRKLLSLAERNASIVAITAAMPEGTGLFRFKERFKNRFFDVGIAEQHAIGFAAGLAKKGLLPVVAIYSTFLQRAYDQLFQEASLQNLPFVLVLDRAGLVGSDGPTHHGIFDFSYLNTLPNITIAAARDALQLQQLLELSVETRKPFAVRFPKDAVPDKILYESEQMQRPDWEVGDAEILKQGDDIILVTIGSMVYPVIEASNLLEAEDFSCTVIDARFLKPIDEQLLLRFMLPGKPIFIIEEAVFNGGLCSAVLNLLQKRNLLEKGIAIESICLDSQFYTFGSRPKLLDLAGLTSKKIYQRIRKHVNSRTVQK